MHTGRTLRILGGADRRQNRGDRRTDVLAHDNRERHRIGDLPGRRERLQDTDRCGRRLDHRSDHRTDNHAEQRDASKCREHLRKGRQVCKRLDRCLH